MNDEKEKEKFAYTNERGREYSATEMIKKKKKKEEEKDML